jgi:outer membrane protein assembly factor BamB
MHISGGRRRRRRWPFVVGGLVALGVAGLVVYLTAGQTPGDVSNPEVEFTTPQEPAPKPKRRSKAFAWPFYGYTPARTRYLRAPLRPPFKPVWRVKAGSLLEFQPTLAKNTLFFVANDGQTRAVSAKTGRVKWRRRVGTLAASSPAWWRDRVFITTLSRRITSLDARTGRLLWKKDLGSRSESSPVVIGGRIYFGAENGTVYALHARSGRTIWTHKLSGAVKGGLAYSRGRLFIGDYAGKVYSLRARNGSEIWSTGTRGRSFGRSGNFYSTPAVAFGRVYLGNTDGKVYSLAASSGRIAWTKSTGSYVYAGAAVGDVPRLGPTVFIGSYDGNFYALDARSGRVRWDHPAGGRISGAATIVGNIVYFSNLAAKSTTGLDVRTGKPVWKVNRGAFNPVISDGRRIYLTGYGSQYAFVPKRRRRET